jgi:lipid II:glycine glycyltransferase (peptidoglycan interpeptide bridge formation enzyme)
MKIFLFRLVTSSLKTSLKLEDMWLLNKEDKNSTLTQKFEKHWRREIIDSKIKLYVLPCSRKYCALIHGVSLEC